MQVRDILYCTIQTAACSRYC